MVGPSFQADSATVPRQTRIIQFKSELKQTNWTNSGNSITATDTVATAFDVIGSIPLI
jgi:hypothetical protein